MKKILKIIINFIFQIDKKDKELILLAIYITNNIKNYTEEKNTDPILLITKNKINNLTLRVLRVFIPKILYQLNLCSVSDLTNNKSIKSASIKLKQMKKQFRGDMLDGIACAIVVIISDNKITWDIAKTVVKKIYDDNKHKTSL